ncbi:uncharacterized protein K02A2.6-like [Lineus longissimus]|uniref:uncharacterized protein K02A2.6-like n=1 Tax=Lineus longissimus TaxID=88925 RepID=UPI00315D323A
MRLYRYDVEFRFLEGTKLVIADTLSRAYLGTQEERPRIMNVDIFEHFPDARVNEVREATKTDTALQAVLPLIQSGWPSKKHSVTYEARPYFDMRHDLSHEDGVILKGEAIVIPYSLRDNMRKRLHAAHLGYDSMMRRARGTVFWPGYAHELKQMADSCEHCQELRPRNQKETLRQHEEGNAPWIKIGTDLFEIRGRQYLVTIDYFSNFIEVDQMTTTTSARVIGVMKKQFARFGIPKCIVSDPGPQFTSREFKKFAKDWGIKHVMSSPGHHNANGKAEAAVKIIEHMMTKCQNDGSDQFEALLELRNTPSQDTGLSPNEMLFGRKTRSFIPCVAKPETIDESVLEKRAKRKRSVRRCHDRQSRDLKHLEIGQTVYFEHRERARWILGKITEVLGDRTYTVRGHNGGTYRRNRVQMRPTKVELRTSMREVSPSRIPNVQSPHAQPAIPESISENTIVSEPTLPNQTAHEPEVPIPLRRSTRITREPARLKDYVCPK